MWLAFSCLIVALAAALSLFFGWGLILLLRQGEVTGSPERWAAAALTGSGVLMLLYGWLSYSGFAGAGAGELALAVAFLTAAPGYWRIRTRFVPAVLGRGVSPIILLAIAAAGAAAALLPVARFHAFNPYNDTFTYITISDYLQRHPFSLAANPDPYFPFLTQVRLYQDGGLRMGSTFFLALLQSLFAGRRAIEFYPAVAAWGVALNVFAIFLAARRLLRMPRRFAFGAAALAAVVPNPLHYLAANGFLPELFGIAFLLLALCRLARLARSGSLHAAVPMALSLAFLASAYSELIPVMLLAVAIVFAAMLLKRGGGSSMFLPWGAAGALTLLFTNVEIGRMARAIPGQVHAVVGMNIAYTQIEFLGSALGANPGPWEPTHVYLLWRHSPLTDNLLAAVLGLLALRGLFAIARRSAGREAFLTAFAVLAGLYLYFALAVGNPFVPGATGQTWSLLKLTQWAYPFMLLLLVSGVAALPRGFWALQGLLAFSVLWSIPVHSRISRTATGNALQWTASTRPFEAYARLAASVNRLEPEGIVELRFTPELMKHRELVAYFLAPRPLIGDWRNDGYLSMLMLPDNRNLRLSTPHLILTGAGDPDAGPRLPAGVAVAMDGAQPRLP